LYVNYTHTEYLVAAKWIRFKAAGLARI